MKLSEAPTFPPIRQGLKVKTPMGEGSINWGRMIPKGMGALTTTPGYVWASASVILDNVKRDRELLGQTYGGTVFAANDIEVLEDW